MADRRADDPPLAPHRSLAGPAEDDAHERTGSSSHPGPAQSPPVGGGWAEDTRVEGTASDRDQADAGPAEGGRPSRPAAPATPGHGTPPGATSTASSSAPAQPAAATPATGRPAAAQARPRGTRRARLRLVHLDPWSVLKTALLLSIAFGIVTVVAVAVVWSVLGAAGVWDSINKTVTDVLGGDSAQNFDVKNYVGTSRVLGFTMFVAAVDVVLITALSTLAAFLYNLAAALLGGIEVTLAEDER